MLSMTIRHRHEHLVPRSVCLTIIDATTAITNPANVYLRYNAHASSCDTFTEKRSSSLRYAWRSSSSDSRRSAGTSPAPMK